MQARVQHAFLGYSSPFPPHTGLLPGSSRRRSASLQELVGRAAKHLARGEVPRARARHGRRRPADGHGLLRPAADVQLDEEPTRQQRHLARGQRLDVPCQQHGLWPLRGMMSSGFPRSIRLLTGPAAYDDAAHGYSID